MPAPWRAADWLILAVIACCGFAVGGTMVLETGRAFFYQTLMPSSIVAACGRGWFEPAAMPPALWSFTIHAAPAFDCALLDGVALEGGIGDNTRVHFYMAWAASMLWRLLGVTTAALWPLAATLVALYATAGFVLGRLFLPRLAAAAIGLLLAASPLANSVLETSLRDYAKAPFFLWAIVLLVLALRAEGGWRLAGLAAALGGVIGLGAGFRSDVTALVPIGILILTLGQWRGPVPLLGRAIALLLFLAVTLTLMAPLRANVQGFLGAIWMQGASEPFRYRLRLAPAPYELGERYSDELTYASIGADLRRPDPAGYDAREGDTLARSQAQRLATPQVLSWAPTFVGDVATRALAAAWLTAGLPTLLNPTTPRVQLYDSIYPGRFTLTQATAAPMTLIASRWTPVVGVAGLLVLLLRIYARSRREALWFGVVVLLLFGLPSLQFALRHLFQMEALFWLSIMALLTAWPVRHALRPRVAGFLAWIVAFGALGFATHAGLVALQEAMLRARIGAVLAAPGQEVPAVPATRPEGRVLLGVAVPPAYRAILDGPFDSAVPAAGHVNFHTVTAAADRLVLTIGGPGCDGPQVSLRLSYALRPETWQPKTRDILVPRPAAGWGQPVQVIAPAFYRASQHFEGVDVPEAQRACVAGIRRVEDDHRLPALFSAVLAPGWEGRPLRLRFVGRLGPPPPR
jgi:hypothetical protein